MAETPAKMYTLASFMTVLAAAAIGLRFYARHLIKACCSWDDWMMIPAMLLTFAIAVCMIVGAAYGHLAQHLEIHSGVAHDTKSLRVFEQVQYAVMVMSVLSMGFTKLSVLLFYRRVLKGEIFDFFSLLVAAITLIWIVGFFFPQLLQCIPFSINWTKVGNVVDQCIDVNLMIMVEAWSDVCTNAVILALPIPVLWKLQIAKFRKLGLCTVFLLGTLTVAAGIAKLVIFHRLFAALDADNTDLTYIEAPFVYWAMVESSLGIAGACLPQMRPVFGYTQFVGVIRRLTDSYSSVRDSIRYTFARASISSGVAKSTGLDDDKGII